MFYEWDDEQISAFWCTGIPVPCGIWSCDSRYHSHAWPISNYSEMMSLQFWLAQSGCVLLQMAGGRSRYCSTATARSPPLLHYLYVHLLSGIQSCCALFWAFSWYFCFFPKWGGGAKEASSHSECMYGVGFQVTKAGITKGSMDAKKAIASALSAPASSLLLPKSMCNLTLTDMVLRALYSSHSYTCALMVFARNSSERTSCGWKLDSS